MEDTLRGVQSRDELSKISLNPCFNGRYSQSAAIPMLAAGLAVLILVLMEDTLRACHRIICQYVCEVS